jgi:hypothetical protein
MSLLGTDRAGRVYGGVLNQTREETARYQDLLAKG